MILRPSKCEEMMVEVLSRAAAPLTIGEIVALVRDSDSSLLVGATPAKSLYSMIFRREACRRQSGQKTLFNTVKERGVVLYSLAS